jgi:tRNA(Ile)-lysidine synthase
LYKQLAAGTSSKKMSVKRNLSYLYQVLDLFKDHINSCFPELMEQPLIVACSGGLDSVVLAHLCNVTGMSFALAHCNFGLREAESDEDERFVEQLAHSLDVPFFVVHFDTMDHVRSHGLSIQMAARELRYQWFSTLCEKEGYTYVLTAHHLDDTLETFLINLSRGTGLDGLTGIPARSNGILRPLLPFRRSEIQDFANQQHLSWREDSSNEETKYLRNKIRHHLVPDLKELHPSFLDNFKMTQGYLSDAAKMLQQHVNKVKESLFTPYFNGYKIDLKALNSLEPLNGYLYALFKEYGFTAWADVEGLLTAMSGKEVHSKTHRLIKDRKYLLLQQIQKGTDPEGMATTLDTPGDLPINLLIEPAAAIVEKDNTILYVDKETLNHSLTVRKRKKGDYFYPLGMNGKKKVSKFFKDEKMDAVAKENQWLLCCGDDIVWIIGRRADDRFKITSDTKKILKITLKE